MKGKYIYMYKKNFLLCFVIYSLAEPLVEIIWLLLVVQEEAKLAK